MIIVMFTQLVNMMPYVGQGAFQFSYVKRFFGWAITKYSWYITVCDLLSAFATMILFPLFHKFHVTNNSVIMLACITQVSSPPEPRLPDGGRSHERPRNQALALLCKCRS